MALILIEVHGERCEVDETLLQRLAITREDALQIVQSVEYCLLDCDGPAHRRQIADCAAHFCDRHVRRDVAVQMKVWPDGLGALVDSPLPPERTDP